MYNTCMRKFKNHFVNFLFFLVTFFSFFVSSANASLDFSIVPVDGGSTLRFSRGDLAAGVTKEVRVRITSNENIQYQVSQQLISPFVNERGVIITRPVLNASILQGSSGSGTVYLSSYEALNRGDQLLYTSSANGMSESFTVIYKVDTQYLPDSGSFKGLVQYTLRPVGGGQLQTVQTNVFIESNSSLKFNVEGSSGSNLVRISSKKDALPGHVDFSFESNSAKDLKIYAEVLTYPTNDLNIELEVGILKLSYAGARNGELSFQQTVDLPRNRVLIYKSSQQSDSFSALFSLSPDDLAKVSAGDYHGRMRFSFETPQGVKNYDFELDINIAPFFEIVLDFPNGSIDFSRVVFGGEPQIKEVDVNVRTNLGRPYAVKQKVADVLINEKSHPIPKQYFNVRQELMAKSLGKVDSTEFVPVEAGETVIFKSDKSGSSANFKIYYRLTPFAAIQSGEYKTAIVYDLGEL